MWFSYEDIFVNSNLISSTHHHAITTCHHPPYLLHLHLHPSRMPMQNVNN
ncbi:hypothetical protein HanIR_Chr06g0282061 [Helianthus annuus]|nr:hypothetical protein HanIR_Chr06g0282061 [Helianthus annuus]